MKVPVMFYVVLTTIMLVTLTIMVSMDLAFSWVFYTMCIGQLFVLIMVYKVLRDTYTTNKTFKDFYEDHPISQYENFR
ncbi:hypothetical protein AB9K26_03840 [Psychroserpens sp. XS_ASV72]|uniref:hypothetical protein n=1 Tax=Psychroserpens sp. XS_ASV72 TaxID=3241293 RepID=UPI003518ECB5